MTSQDWELSSTYAIRFMETACYGTDLDGSIRTGSKILESAEDMLTSRQAFKEEIDRVNGALTDGKEKKAGEELTAAVAQDESVQPKTKMIHTDEKNTEEKADEQQKEHVV